MAAKIEQVRVPLTNMTFHPDVPSAALNANEYNNYNSRNIETDVRGIRSVFGDEEILAQITGTPIHVTGGYRDDEEWYYIIGTSAGRWYWILNSGAPVNITPGVTADPAVALPGYSLDTTITDSWNGTTVFINDGINAPMFLSGTATEFVSYSQFGNEYKFIDSITGNGNVATATYYTPFSSTDDQFAPGQLVNITNPSGNATAQAYVADAIAVTFGNLTLFEFSSTSSNVTGGGLADTRVYPTYEWNYNGNWKTLSAGWQRIYNSPNVGSIMIAGNLTATDFNDATENYPNTVRWSQAFGLNDAPLTWRPTLTNVANELEVPVRGPVLDGFNLGGNFYVLSYWDTVVFSPINYQTTTIPILGARLLNQGRGLLNTNCWAAADDVVFGLDARDIWAFDGRSFRGIGNQRIKEFFYSRLNPDYTNRVFLNNNTVKNQIEIYYPDLDSTGWCNKMISYRYDLDVWNPPRDVSNASEACEAPFWGLLPDSSLGYDPSLRTVTYCQGVANSYLVQKDVGHTFINSTPITSYFQRDNIQILPKYSEQLMVHRVLPAVNNVDDFGLQTTSTGNVSISVGGADSVGQAITFKNTVVFPIDTGNPWIQVNQNVFRVNSIKIEHTSSTDSWFCSAVTWQVAQTQEAV